MAIATLTFDRPDAPLAPSAAELEQLRESVIDALQRVFPTYNEAALAQAEHRYVRAHVEGDPLLPLFSMYETFRAAVSGNTKALKWETFVRDAQKDSTRFSRD